MMEELAAVPSGFAAPVSQRDAAASVGRGSVERRFRQGIHPPPAEGERVMSYSLVIEGTMGARSVRRGDLPRRGDWLSLNLGGAYWWLPVLEISNSMSPAEICPTVEAGCVVAHKEARPVVFSSLAMGVRVDLRREDDEYKLVMPPSRWPFGGRSTGEA